MKKTALIVASLVAGVSAQAQNTADALSVTLDTTVVSEYNFRGQEVSDLTVHPSIEFAYGDFYAGIWGALPAENNAGADFKEFDFYAGYGMALNDVWSLDVGATWYTYADTPGSDDTIEIYAGVAGAVGDFDTSLYAYYDFDLENLTTQGSVGYSVPVEAIGSSLDFSATLGYVSAYDNAGDSYLYYGVGVSVPYQLADNATLTVGLNYANADKSANDGDTIYGSIGVAIGF